MAKIHDIHPHVISKDETKYPRDPIGGTQSDWSRERPVTIEEMIEEMDRAGVASSALVQSATCYGFDNSYICEAIERFPDRFTGIASIAVLADDAVDVMKSWMDRGVSGLRIYTGGSKMNFDYDVLADRRADPIWDFCGEAGIPICLQVRVPAFPIVKELAERHPNTRIAIDHLARADPSDGPPYRNAQPLWDLAKYDNIFLKVTPRSFLLAKEGKASPDTFFPTLVERFGANRLAFGSNFPAAKGPLADIVQTAKDGLSALSEEDRNWILGGTSERLYPALA